jgi:hypothetical protein
VLADGDEAMFVLLEQAASEEAGQEVPLNMFPRPPVASVDVNIVPYRLAHSLLISYYALLCFVSREHHGAAHGCSTAAPGNLE